MFFLLGIAAGVACVLMIDFVLRRVFNNNVLIPYNKDLDIICPSCQSDTVRVTRKSGKTHTLYIRGYSMANWCEEGEKDDQILIKCDKCGLVFDDIEPFSSDHDNTRSALDRQD